MRRHIVVGAIAGALVSGFLAHQRRKEFDGFFGPMPGFIVYVCTGTVLGGVAGDIVYPVRHSRSHQTQIR